MPKNEKGIVVCINHHDIEMKKEDDTVLLQIRSKEKGEEKPSIKLGSGYLLDYYSCNECGYAEFYEPKE